MVVIPSMMVAAAFLIECAISHVACQTPQRANEPSFQRVVAVGVPSSHAGGMLPTCLFAFDDRCVGALLHTLPSLADDARCKLARTVDHLGNSPGVIEETVWEFAIAA